MVQTDLDSTLDGTKEGKVEGGGGKGRRVGSTGEKMKFDVLVYQKSHTFRIEPTPTAL